MEQNNNHVCPVWLGYVFLFPIRKFQHNPEKLLAPHIKEGMTVMDYGCAMGYFSLPMAKMVGTQGKAYCVDIQVKMLEKLQKRAEKAGLSQIIQPLLVGKTFDIAKLQNEIDFALLFAVVHEVPDKKQLFTDLFSIMKSGGEILLAEPKGHVTPEDFAKTILLAQSAGFHISEEKPIRKGLSAFLVK